ncbi:GIY-YIG nuclease family protein [Lutibacter sp.]|uniref:GIY-YIG nuclease family protein n=1 Tax=Lutibacter sp. TaxID=1925666 RepID=UPI0025C0BE09|nr:GIY-YIG nuclease family protein [Lutibacter sp.]MCF6182472.1 GIY-YIG nuclease family protein [Lutibacter sp.]
MIEFKESIYSFYVYIITNTYRTTFYIGVTNNLNRRLQEHNKNIEKNKKTFAAKYNLKDLVYYQKFGWVQQAIAREKELKGWRRKKKLDLIKAFNPTFKSLNHLFEQKVEL